MARRQISTTGTQPDKPRRTRRVRSAEERKDIMMQYAIHEDMGESQLEISQALDVPRSTLQEWISQGDLESIRNGTSDLAYRHLKAKMLEEVVGSARRAIRLFNAKADAGDAKAAKDAAISIGIMTEKSLLLMGQATGRVEHVRGEGGVTVDMFQEAMKALGVRLPSKAEPIDAEYAVKDECDKTRA